MANRNGAGYSTARKRRIERIGDRRVYHQSNSLKNSEELVIGRLDDTATGAQLGMRRLNDPDWTINVNDAWIQGGIDARKLFCSASPITARNLRTQPYPHHPYFSTTVTYRELL